MKRGCELYAPDEKTAHSQAIIRRRVRLIRSVNAYRSHFRPVFFALTSLYHPIPDHGLRTTPNDLPQIKVLQRPPGTQRVRKRKRARPLWRLSLDHFEMGKENSGRG